MNRLQPDQYDENLLAHGIVRPLAPDEEGVLESALRLSGVKVSNIRNAKPIEFLPDPEWTEDHLQSASDHLARTHAMATRLPDSILQSAIYGRLMAAALSAVSAGVLALDQAQAALAAGLAIVGAALALASKVREWLRARQ